VVLGGALAALVDRNADGVLSGGARDSGQINLATDEMVQLATPAATLADDGFAGVRAAIGTLSNATSGADVLVLANNATSAGLYLVIDANGDGQVAATEIRLLGVFNAASGMTSGGVTLG
jgi:hypothetical protein